MTSPIAGWAAKVYETGTKVVAAGEACNAIADDPNGNHRYQITNAAHRWMWPADGATVKGNGIAIAVANILSINGMNGIITFQPAYVPAAPVTIDYSYVPFAVPSIFAKMASVAAKRTLLDKSQFGASFKQKMAGLKEMSGSIKSLLTSNQIYTGVSSTQIGDLLAGTVRGIEIDPSGTGAIVFRFWALLSAAQDTAGVDTIVEDALTFDAHSESNLAALIDGSPYVGAP